MIRSHLYRSFFVLLAVTFLTYTSVDVQGDLIIVDQSPAATGGTQGHVIAAFDSLANTQNFSDKIVLSVPTVLSGVDLYLSDFAEQNPVIGDSVTIRIRATVDGPVLHEFTDPIVLVDNDGIGTFTHTVRAHVDFTSDLLLAVGEYWIGMPATSKSPFGFGQVMIDGGSGPNLDNSFAHYENASIPIFRGLNTSGDMAFRVYAIPEPTTLTLASLSLLAIAYRPRLRRRC